MPGVSWKEKIKKKRIEVGRKSIILEVENKSYLACRLPFHDSLTLLFLAILSFNLNFLLIFGNFMPCTSVLPISWSSHSPLHTCRTPPPMKDYKTKQPINQATNKPLHFSFFSTSSASLILSHGTGGLSVSYSILFFSISFTNKSSLE